MMLSSGLSKIRLGISSCLLGNAVRYDGGHKLDHYFAETLGNYIDWIPVCPEVECGLPVPREPMHVVGEPEDPRLVTVQTRVDHTSRVKIWAKTRFAELEHEELCGFVFKSRSPSCGMRGIRIHTKSGRPSATGSGIFADAFVKRFPLMPVENNERFHDPLVRLNFIERIFTYRRWQDYIRNDGSLNGLVVFHTEHKLLIMAHSRKHYTTLGKIVAHAKRMRRDELRRKYFETLMEGMGCLATVKKNTNVLQQMAGYFKKALSVHDKRELQEVIGNYHDGLLPLIVPLTLLRHYATMHQEGYLSRQYYLNPHPVESMLRNHV
jgi:uncharacterized protein YbgA (DUF1722 family)/uncharacterized protein YbbK (DUF523 family)